MHRPPEAQHNAGCPMPLVLDILGQRWGVPPWVIEDAPLDRVQFYINVATCEAEAHADHAGLAPGEAVIRMD